MPSAVERQPLRVLLVAEGSGGHLIPTFQVARTLAHVGARVKVWYVRRQSLNAFAQTLAPPHEDAIELEPLPMRGSSTLLEKFWRCGQLWSRAEQCFSTFAPDVVVGFGGWVSAPVLLAAKRRHLRCLLHEQNVLLGRANRLLARWVDRVAVSFDVTQSSLDGIPSVITGLPIRQGIGRLSRREGAARFGFQPERPTLLVVGGSQGARAINRALVAMAAHVSAAERQRWQVLHITGAADEQMVRRAYAAAGLTAHVAAFLAEMDAAYAQADLVVARAGASTIAELACCGTPAILIPYPHAGGHQRANAQLVEALGGGMLIEESDATSQRLLAAVRRILGDERLRTMMGVQMRSLQCADTGERLTDAIVALAHAASQRNGHSA